MVLEVHGNCDFQKTLYQHNRQRLCKVKAKKEFFDMFQISSLKYLNFFKKDFSFLR